MLKSDLERATRSAESLSEKNKERERAQVEDLMEKKAALNESLPPEEARANASGLAEVSLSSEPPSFSKLNNTGTPSLQLEMELEKIKSEYEQERSAHEITKRTVERLESQAKSMISEVENGNEQNPTESNKLEVKVDRDNKLEIKVDLNDRSEECERLGNQMNHLQERIRAQSLSSRELKLALANTTGQLEEQKSLISSREIEMKTLQSSKVTLENELHHSTISPAIFLDASSHLYKRPCPSVGWLVRPLVRWSVTLSSDSMKNGCLGLMNDLTSPRISVRGLVRPSVHLSVG